ncbi:MAG: hypothetical protein WB630_02940 [Candidatus Acidiferrales bacterium]
MGEIQHELKVGAARPKIVEALTNQASLERWNGARVSGGPLGIWRRWAPRAHGEAMKGWHFFPEESPKDMAALIRQFPAA